MVSHQRETASPAKGDDSGDEDPAGDAPETAENSTASAAAQAHSSSGAEITVLLHRTLLGFPITTHCIYKTESTFVGRGKDSSVTGKTPTVEIGSTPILQVATDSACGDNAELTGNVVVTSPDLVYIDKSQGASRLRLVPLLR